ncbi:MAG: helix-turn-helix domain-containing protein [Bacteroidota bacterium]
MIDIKKYLEFHLSDITTVGDLARHLQVSPETLRKNFRRTERISLGQYILKLKVEVMKEYLVIGDDPCNWICGSLNIREDTGAKLFKRYTGETMKQYRDRHRENGIGPMIQSDELNTQAVSISNPPSKKK